MQHLQHIAELGPLLEKLKIRQVIISPGSRNAPLTQLFTGSDAFKCHSIVDERSAGYVALGMARQLQEAVAVVTTSGTAVMNLAPAVAEAFYQHMPLIILTADRPQEMIKQFNNQVIDQTAPFFNHSRGFYELPPVLRSEDELKHALLDVERLVLAAKGSPGGPVHINVPLEEPLYENLPEPLFSGMELVQQSYPPVQDHLALKRPHEQNKILVLAGMGLYDREIQRLAEELSCRRQFALVAENIANMRSDLFIANPELILAGASENEREELVPDLVVAFGGQVVSKQLKHFVQKLKGVEIRVIEEDPLSAMKEIAAWEEKKEQTSANTYLSAWKRIETREVARVARFLESSPFCNLTAVQRILAALPKNCVVHLGNSATIRNSQLMPVRQDLTYFSNRGTSGIDGSVSAAVGAAMVSEMLHVLLVGDLSFVYDSNALWNRNFPSNLKLIVLNDSGGGIFRLLEGPDRMAFFEEYSVTHHPVSLELLSQSFGRRYMRASNGLELTDQLPGLFEQGSSLAVLEVDTSDSENSRIFRELFDKNH